MLNFHDDDHKVSMRGIPGVTLRVFASEVRHVVKGVCQVRNFEEIVMRGKKRSKQDFFEPQHFVGSIVNRCRANGFRCRRSSLLFVTPPGQRECGGILVRIP